MLRFVADENFSGRIVRGLRRQVPKIDIVRVQDTDLAGASDPDVLKWAAEDGRILLTHDVATVTAFAYERVDAGQAMAEVIEVRQELAIGRAIDDIALLATVGEPSDVDGQILYLPL